MNIGKMSAFFPYLLASALFAPAAWSKEDGYLGIRFKKLEKPVLCLRVEHVFPGSAADRAGVLEGDLLSKVNGLASDCAGTIERPLPKMSVGETFILSLVRDGKTLEISMTAEAPPSEATRLPKQADMERNAKLSAADALMARMVRDKTIFTVVMEANGEYRYEGNLTREEAALLHWFDYEVMAGPQMHKIFPPGRHHRYLSFDQGRNAYDYHPVPESKP